MQVQLHCATVHVICNRMINGLVLVLTAGCFIASNIASADYLDDDYNEEELRNLGIDRLDLLRKYVYRNNFENRRAVNDEFENWHGRWMPDRPNQPTPPPKIFPKTDDLYPLGNHVLLNHGISMGVPSKDCDDAKTNLTVDWDQSPVNYTCYDGRIIPNRETVPMKYCERIPLNYEAMHKCMFERIDYDTELPLYGTHRPLWPVYGEYKFVPKQRWLHSLEHGAIVMLYHPCANPLEVKRLKSLVTGCIRRHIITPYNLLTEDRPLTLLSWGCRMSMSYVNPNLVKKFIKEHGIRGPEQASRDGDFNDGLLIPAKIVSDTEDSVLCPNINQ